MRLKGVLEMPKVTAETHATMVVGYCRVSSHDQKDNYSIETQKDSIAKYCLQNGIVKNFEDISWIEDSSVSAFKVASRNRAGFKQILQNSIKGDVVVASRLDRIWRSVGDAALCLEEMKKLGVHLHIVDKGCVTSGDASATLSLHILASVASFDSALKGERIRESKKYMKENHMWLGGKRKRGFSSAKIGNKKFTVSSLGEKQVLEYLLKIKRERDLQIKENKSGRLANSNRCTVNQIKNRLEVFCKKHGLINVIDKFSRATLYRLLSDDGDNVVARVQQIKDSEKKIVRVDGNYVVARDLAKTSRQDEGINGGPGKQLSLFQAGLKTKQKVSPGIKMRHVKKSNKKLVTKVDGAKWITLL